MVNMDAELLVERTSQPQGYSSLPAGLNANETLQVIVIVADGVGAEAHFTKPVQCRSPSGDEAADSILESLTAIDEKLSEGNAFNALVLLHQSSRLLNSAAATPNGVENRATRRTAAANVTEEVATRTAFLNQLVQASETMVVNEQGLQLQASGAMSVTFGGRVDNATSLKALSYTQTLATNAFTTNVMTAAVSKSLVGTLSNLLSANVQNTSTSIVSIRDILNKTTALQNALLVNGEAAVETKSDNIIISSSRQELSSGGATIGLAPPSGPGARRLTTDGGAASFRLPAMNIGSSVGIAYVQFMENPYAFAGEQANEGLASEVTALDIQSINGPVTQFEGGIAVVLPVSNSEYADIDKNIEVVSVVSQNVTCAANSTLPSNIQDITFECPDERGITPNITCNGYETYSFTLTCQSIETVVASCVFWDVQQEAWSDEGCEFKGQTNGSLACNCTHLTDYVARFSVIGTNFLGTIDHFAEISLAAALVLLPALIFLVSIPGVSVTCMVLQYGLMKKKTWMKIAMELEGHGTAVMFQHALRKQSIAQFLVQEMHKGNAEAVAFLLTYDAALKGLEGQSRHGGRVRPQKELTSLRRQFPVVKFG